MRRAKGNAGASACIDCASHTAVTLTLSGCHSPPDEAALLHAAA